MAVKGWYEYHGDILRLVGKLDDYRPDIIAPCMLGGLIPGAIMAKCMGITDVRPIDIEREGSERRLAYDVQGNIDGKKVLILEDDLPTGKGPVIVKRLFEWRGADVKIAAVYVTPSSREVVDFYAVECEELPDYPWKKFHGGDRIRNR